MHRLVSVCPALRACTLHLPDDLSIGLLSAMAVSCPLLTHLQLLNLSHGSSFFTSSPSAAAQQHPPPPTPFRSLINFDLHYIDRAAEHSDMPSLSALHPFLIGSPLQQLTVVMHAEAHYQASLTQLMAVTQPTLQTVKVMYGEADLLDAPIVGRAWDDVDFDDQQDEKQPVHAPTRSLPLFELSLSNPALPHNDRTPLRSLKLIVLSKLLPIDHLSALLAQCSTVTSIHLTIHDKDRLEVAERDHVLVTLLHCIAAIGQHCPLIEQIGFHIHHVRPLPPNEATEVSLEEVMRVVDAYEMPVQAFARLERLREVGGWYDALNETAAAYVRRRWLHNAHGAVLNHMQPLPTQSQPTGHSPRSPALVAVPAPAQVSPSSPPL